MVSESFSVSESYLFTLIDPMQDFKSDSVSPKKCYGRNIVTLRLCQ